MAHGRTHNGIYTKHEKEADKLRMAGGAWSVNLTDFDIRIVNTIEYITETKKYTISTRAAQDHGFTRELGGEPKLVVPIGLWKVEKNDTARET